VQLEDGKTLPADAQFLRFEGDKTWFEITIREGRNQQIRRMGDATGFRVMRLARVAFAGVTVEGLRPGDIRPLTYDELVAMKKEFGVPRSPRIAHGMEALPTLKRAAKRGDVPEVRDARTRAGDGERDRRDARPRKQASDRDRKPSAARPTDEPRRRSDRRDTNGRHR
jgi:23S rRNA pseudouridine2605 synthase